MARWFRDRSHHLGIPSVSLRRLLPEARFVGCQDFEVTGCSSDSRRLEPGQLFVMLRHDPRDLALALEHGATGVLLEHDCPDAGPIRIVVPDSRHAQARLCHALAGEPSRHLDLIAVAGTRGRTPAAVFLRSILEASGQRFGHVGGLGWSDGSTHYPRTDFEPTADILAQMLASMAERRCPGAIVELPPSALASRLDEGLEPLQAVIATTLPPPSPVDADPFATRRDHARLLRRLSPRCHLVLNADDAGVGLLGAVRLDVEPIAYGFDGPADLRAVAEPDGPGGQRLQLRGLGGWLTIRLRVPGRLAASGAAAAATLARLRGIPDEVIIAGLETLDQIPDHLEAVRGGQAFGLWIDAARTPGDLADSLRSLRQGVRGVIHLVLTLTDASRPDAALAAVAEELADRVVLTCDADGDGIDPEPWTLAFQEPDRLRVDHDRIRAIETTLAAAADDDAVLIISGRRPKIERAGRRIRFLDERAVATGWIADAHRARVSLARQA